MEKQALKDILYGGINELIQDKKYYYNSGIGSSYSHWTDEGKESATAYMHSIAQLMIDVDHKLLDKRAKELVMNGLKGEKV